MPRFDTAAFKERIARIRDDGRYFTPEDAIELFEGRSLSAAEKDLVARSLRPSDFGTDAERASTLASIGIDTSADEDDEEFFDKLKAWLQAKAKEELYAKREVDVVDFEIGDFGGVGIKLQGQLIADDDSLIKRDRIRSAYTQERREAGRPLTWALAGGGIFLKAGASAGIPAGPTMVTLGFKAGGSIGYSLLAPYARSAGSALELLRNVSVDLPLSATKARKLKPGTELALAGQGNVAATASVGAKIPAVDVASVLDIDVSLGLSAKVFLSRDILLRVKRLEADEVFLSISHVKKRGRETDVSLELGTKAETESVIPELGGGYVERGAELAADALEDQVGKWARIDLRRAHTITKIETELTNYVLDLANPGAARAYRDLLRLDTRQADGMVGRQGSGVRSARLRERVHSDADAIQLKLGKVSLLSAISKGEKTKGTLALDGSKYIEYRRTDLKDSYTGLISDIYYGKRSLSRQIVETRRGDKEAWEAYYRITYTVHDDQKTDQEDLRRFLSLAEMLGVVDDAERFARDHAEVLARLRRTDRKTDVWITDAGLSALGKASETTLHQAFWNAYETIDRMVDPSAAGVMRECPWLVKEEAKRRGLVNLLKSVHPQRAPKANDQADYRVRTSGRSLVRDAPMYREANMLVELFQKIGQATKPGIRSKLLFEANARLGLPFWRELGMIVQVGQRSNIVVQRLSIKEVKRDVELVLACDDSRQDPQQEIDRLLTLGG